MDEPRYHLGSVVHAKGETLEDFDGPLDVILLLLSKNKIEIQDIQISAILEQYLAYLDEMKRMDMEIASEFIAMASYLMYIKTRMLLSKAEQEEAQSEMDKLVESLQKRHAIALIAHEPEIGLVGQAGKEHLRPIERRDGKDVEHGKARRNDLDIVEKECEDIDGC